MPNEYLDSDTDGSGLQIALQNLGFNCDSALEDSIIVRGRHNRKFVGLVIIARPPSDRSKLGATSLIADPKSAEAFLPVLAHLEKAVGGEIFRSENPAATLPGVYTTAIVNADVGADTIATNIEFVAEIARKLWELLPRES